MRATILFKMLPKHGSIILHVILHDGKFVSCIYTGQYSPVPLARDLRGEEVGVRRRKREAQGMRLVHVLWHQISVKNTDPKYIGR